MTFALTALTITAAYTVFGMTGFGAAMVAMPLLVQFKPLAHAVPLMLLLDLAATLMVGSRNWRSVAFPELLCLIPCMLIGVILGAAALNYLDAKPLLLCLGVFVICNALWSLRSIDAHTCQANAGWVIPSGVIGGIFGATFGTGGPIYTIYLVRRIADMGSFRATIAVVILISALLRTAVFGATGLLSDGTLALSALSLSPFCIAGVLSGSALRRRFTPQRIRKLVLSLLFIGGSTVIIRALYL
jgi:hypothetical protein